MAGALIRLAAVLGALLAGAVAQAESARRFDAYEVHYNAFNADFLPEDVARRHGLPRSRSRGLLNVTVLKHLDGGASRSVEATIAVTATNAAGLQQTVRMRPIRADGALNYLGEFRIAGGDVYRFAIDVTPGDSAKTYSIRYSQELVGP